MPLKNINACSDVRQLRKCHVKNLRGEGGLFKKASLNIDLETERTFGTAKWNFTRASPYFSALRPHMHSDSSQWIMAVLALSSSPNVDHLMKITCHLLP